MYVSANVSLAAVIDYLIGYIIVITKTLVSPVLICDNPTGFGVDMVFNKGVQHALIGPGNLAHSYVAVALNHASNNSLICKTGLDVLPKLSAADAGFIYRNNTVH